MDSVNKSFQIRFNPKSGSIYKYEVSRNRDVIQEIGEDTLSSAYEEKMLVTYKTFTKEMVGYNNTIEFDFYNMTNDRTTNESKQLSKDSFLIKKTNISEAFKGSLFELEVNHNGRLKNISGFQDFKRKKDSLFEDSSITPKLLPKIENTYNEGYFKCLFEKSFHFFPDTSVFINSSWINYDSTECDEPFKTNTRYTVDKVKDGKICIVTFANIDHPLKESLKSMRMVGTETGTIELDSETGMVINSERVLVVKGNVKLGKLNMLMTIHNIVRIKGTKYK